MNREQVASGLLALLAVLALGGVAATLDAPTGGAGSGSGTGDGVGASRAPTIDPGGEFEPVDPPTALLVVLGVVLLGALGAGAAYATFRLADGGPPVALVLLLTGALALLTVLWA